MNAVTKLLDRGEISLPFAIVELGCQFFQERLSPELFVPFFNRLGFDQSVEQLKSASPYDPPEHYFVAKDVFDAAGCTYVSLDLDTETGAIPFDLNYDSVGDELLHRFDIVTNFGTTEHVLNQANAFKVSHDLCREGGFIVHQLPAAGYFEHGFINYNPKLFSALAIANDYETVDSEWSIADQNMKTVWSTFGASSGMNEETAKRYRYADGSMFAFFKKRFNQPFRYPVDGFYVEIYEREDASIPVTEGYATHPVALLIEENDSLRKDIESKDKQIEELRWRLDRQTTISTEYLRKLVGAQIV